MDLTVPAGGAASGRRPALTGIRTVAAAAVCLTHAAFWTGHYTDDYVGRLAARFEVGVAIFFVLSGYLLFSPWVRALRDGPRPFPPLPYPPLRRYAWHRARRILPAYWLTVLAVYAIFLVRTDASDLGHGWEALVRNLTFTQVYGFGYLHTGLTQMWSMSAEVAYYVALPVVAWPLARIVCRDRWRPDLLLAVLAGLAVCSPVWTLVVHGLEGVDPTARLWPPAFASWFVAGMLLAVVAALVTRIPAGLCVTSAAAAFFASGGAFAGEPTIVPDDGGAAVVKHLLYAVVALGVVAPLTVGDGRWSRLCGSRPMVWFGEISYEFFLVHVMVMELVMDVVGFRVFTGSTVVVFAVTSLVSVPVAWLVHRITAPLWRRGDADRSPAAGRIAP
ncbi:acyltransferase family protein [Gordonia shandongensis]|uniref:acyltransferase family protein n=1 Tax=Gordonia shandongensis TaxID=376351 RepID=UPI000401CCC3|nr:acyltransferase [Gordonia shandongensis]